MSAVLSRSAGCFFFFSTKLVIEKSLAELAKRRTDGATIIRSQDSGVMKAVVFKLNANPVEPVLVERYGVRPFMT